MNTMNFRGCILISSCTLEWPAIQCWQAPKLVLNSRDKYTNEDVTTSIWTIQIRWSEAHHENMHWIYASRCPKDKRKIGAELVYDDCPGNANSIILRWKWNYCTLNGSAMLVNQHMPRCVSLKINMCLGWSECNVLLYSVLGTTWAERKRTQADPRTVTSLACLFLRKSFIMYVQIKTYFIQSTEEILEDGSFIQNFVNLDVSA